MGKLKEQDLIRITKKIESVKSEISELRGQKKALLNELKEKFDCDSVSDAEKLAQQLEAKSKKLENSIKKDLKKIEENYPELLSDED